SGEVFASVAKLDELVDSFSTVSRPRMRIAAFASFSARLLPGIIESVAGDHPNLRFDIQLNEPARSRRSHCLIEIRSEVPQDGLDHLPDVTRVSLYAAESGAVVAGVPEVAGRQCVPVKVVEAGPWVDHDVWSGLASRVVGGAGAA